MIFLHLAASAYYPTVRNFTKDMYRSGAQNWAVTQGAGGNMWFANSGILEYDGNEWSIYQTLNRTSARSLFYDDTDGRLYFGATGEFGYISISQQREMEYVSLMDSLKVSVGDIWGIHKIGDTFWLRENNSVFSYDSKQVKQYSFPDKVAVSVIIDGQIIIFVNNKGVFRFDERNGFGQLEGTGFLNDKRVCSILETDGDIVFITATDGIYRLSDGRLTEYETELGNLMKKDNIYCASSNEKYIAFGTVRNGVYIKDISEGRTIHINTNSGLQNNTVLSMFFDHQDNLWLGLDKGIDIIELGAPEYRMFGDPNRFGAGYASEIFEEKLWLGTNQGLYVTDSYPENHIPDDSHITEISAVKGQVWALQVYDGHLFCCNDKGIHIIKNGRIRHIPINGAWKLEALKEHPDFLLGSSYDRLFLLRKAYGRWEFGNWIDGFDESSKVFEEDKDGSIWFSHWVKGLFRLTLNVEEHKVTDIGYFSRNEGFPEEWGNIPMDIDGEIIFHTTDGFYRFDTYNNSAYKYERLNSLFSTPPSGTSIYVTPENDIYFSSADRQSFCYRTDSGYVIDSLSLNSLRTRRIVGFEDIRSISENIVMVNTEDGFSLIRINNLKEKPSYPEYELYIKEISLTQEDDSTVFVSRGGENYGSRQVIEVPYKYNTLKFKAILPTYSSGSGAVYSFMLEEFDREWSLYSESNSKEYTRLPAGRYRFRARARTPISGKVFETSTDLVILAPWYMSRWAFLGYTVIFIALIWMVMKVINILTQKRARQMEEENMEEMRRRQMKIDLEHKAQDLAASTMNIIRKNEILLEIDSELEKVAEYMAEDRNRSLKLVGKIRHAIHENIQHDDVWQKFEKNFDIVYDDFLKRLGIRFPHLTVADKKMCAYLKMDLTSKEIAPLLNLTVRSVEMSRYRLRKKLGLNREDNLTEFLQNF